MKVKIASLIVSLWYLPFSLFLTYLILVKINASDLMWFLYWMLLPMVFLAGILSKLAEWEED
jgi:hypothetical protein